MLVNPLIRNGFIVLGVLMAIVFFLGLKDVPTTGGDIPVTIERLSGSRLTDIHIDLSWTFSDTVAVVENRGQPIPPDVVQELLGNESTPTVISATWQLDEKADLLRLFNANVDGQKIDSEIKIMLKPAGQVRVNLGGRQYNMSRNNFIDR